MSHLALVRLRLATCYVDLQAWWLVRACAALRALTNQCEWSRCFDRVPASSALPAAAQVFQISMHGAQGAVVGFVCFPLRNE